MVGLYQLFSYGNCLSLCIAQDKETERKATGPKINATDGDIGINATLEYTIECEFSLLGYNIKTSNEKNL